MIRYTPTLSFELDTSIEHGVRLTQLIDSVKKADEQAARTSDSESAAAERGGDFGGERGAAGETGAAAADGHVVDAGDYIAPHLKSK